MKIQFLVFGLALIGHGFPGSPLQAAPGQDPDRAACHSDHQEPTRVHQVEPAYPPDAAMLCLEGKVHVEAVVGSDGQVRQIEITDSTPRAVFDRPTTAAISEWTFVPACREGEPVDRRFTTEVKFEMSDHSWCPQTERLSEAEWSILSDMVIDPSVIGLAAWDGTLESASFDTLVGPGGQYTGALARLEHAHRQHMKDLAEFLLEARQRIDQTGYHAVLDPARLAADDGLEDSRQTIEALRELMTWAEAQSLEIAGRFYRQTAIPGLGPELSRLISFHDPASRPPTPEGGVDYDSLPQQAIDQIEQLIDALDDHPGQWRVANGEIRFDDPALEARYQAGLGQLQGIEQNLEMARIAARLD